MSVQRVVLAFAGFVVLVSLALSATVDHRFAWVTAFVGVNLFQSAFTRVCPLAWMLRKAGVPKGECAWR